jgi:hypothetical protein
MTFFVRHLAGVPVLALGLMVLAITPAVAQDTPAETPDQPPAAAQADGPQGNRNAAP